MYAKEDPQGVWPSLTEKSTYYLYVQQDKAQYEEDMKKMKEIWAGAAKGEKPRTTEGCSCLYGSPCVDDSVCLDWDNRLAVAKAHGMLPLAG